jgi:hypothetical protein
VLLSREISIPSRKVLKSPLLHRFAFTGWLAPGLTGSEAILARELLKCGTQSCSATSKGSLVSDPVKG